MAYIEKSLNTAHFTRPAVVLFKKPLATNEEMTAELEKLIGDAYPMETHTLTSYSGKGNPKAIFYCVSTGAYKVVNYDENAYFHIIDYKDTKENILSKKIDFDLATAKAPVINSSFRRKLWKTAVDSVSLANPATALPYIIGIFLKKSTTTILQNTGKILTNDFLKEAIDKYYDGVDKESEDSLTNTLNRTWYVFSLDDDYYVPEIKYNVKETLGTNYQEEHYVEHGPAGVESTAKVPESFGTTGYGISTLDTHVVQSTCSLTKNAFIRSAAFARNREKLIEIFAKYKILSIYQVVLQESVDCKDITKVTYKQALDDFNNYMKNANAKAFAEFNCEIATFYNSMYNKYSFRAEYYKATDEKNFRIIDKFSASASKFLSTDKYKIKVTTLFPELNRDLLLAMNPKIANGVEYPLSAFKGAFRSLYNLSYYVDSEGGNSKVGYIVFTESDTFRDAVDAYYFLAERINRSINAVDAKTEQQLLKYYNVSAEFPLRYKYQELTTGSMMAISASVLKDDYNTYGSDQKEQKVHINDNNAVQPTGIRKSNTIQFRAFLESMNRGRIGTRESTTITYTSRKMGGFNPLMIDFKLMYYMMIKYNVVLPKYNKLEPEFIHGNNSNSTVRMFPINFFTATGKLESGTFSNISGISRKQKNSDGTTNYAFDFESIKKLPIKDKKRLVSMYESVYYGGWAGFYYTNATTYSEDIAPYYNTQLSDEVLTTIQEVLNEEDESNYTEKFSPLTDFTDFRYLTELNDVKNSDVSDIVVSRQTMGKSQATITLKNNDNKYVFKDGIFKGECIFEPMDEVSIYLPTTSGGLTLSFTGFLDSTDVASTNGYNMISLQCSCPIKLLEINRTNVKPSMSGGLEADYAPLNPFLVPPKMMESMEKWVPFMFVQPLTYMTSMLGDITSPESTYTYKTVELASEGGYHIFGPKFEDDLLQYLWSRRSQHIKDSEAANLALKNLIDKYTDTVTYKNGEELGSEKPEPGIKDLQEKYSYNSKSNKKDYVKCEYNVYAQRSDNFLSESGTRKAVAQLTGTLQPAFALGASEIPLVFSNYKTNLELLTETAEKFNFFLYSNRFGVVRFAPPMVSLANLSIRDGVLNESARDDEYDYSYYTDSPDILSKQNTISFRESCDDSKLVTWIQLTGGLVASASLDVSKAGVATPVANWPLIKKYGYHSQKQQAVIGINSLPALRAYGMALMDRANKNFRTATCDTMGSGDIDINKTVYSSINNTVYLRVGLSSHYQAGNTFITSSTLNWGRKPLCTFFEEVVEKSSTYTEYNTDESGGYLSKPENVSILPKLTTLTRETMSRDVNIDAFKTSLETLFKQNLITNAYYRQIKGLLSAYDTNKNYKQLFYSFIFNGYFWEGVPSISFEDLSTEFYSENVANGLEESVFSGQNPNDKKGKKKPKTKEINNTTSVFLGLFDQSSVSKMQDTYTS